jgi:uncharacterized membrane protein YcfT
MAVEPARAPVGLPAPDAPADQADRGRRPATARLAWVDATRGYCVAAVVLFHTVLWYVGGLEAPLHPAAGSVWGAVNTVLGSVRMPMLLAVSGLVLSRQVREGLHRSTTVFRGVNNYYLYVVWLAVYAGFYALLQQEYLRHRVDGWEVLVQLVVPGTTLWYLYALALYVPLLALARRLPPWLVLAALVALSTWAHAARAPGQMWVKIPELFVFFAVGVYGASAIRRLAGRAGLRTIGATALVAVGVTALGRFAGSELADAALFVARGVAFMAFTVTVVAVAVRWAPVRGLGVALGRRTLVVYVMHPLLIALLMIWTHEAGGDVMGRVVASGAAAMALPLVVTAAVVAASIGVQLLAERGGLSFLFEMPGAWRRRFGRA